MTATISVKPELKRETRYWSVLWYSVVTIGIAVGIVLRFSSLTIQSFWFDEGLEAWMIRLPVREIIRMCRADVSAPLHFIALRLWSKIFGMSEQSLRGFSAFCASLALILFFDLARKVLKSPLAACV